MIEFKIALGRALRQRACSAMSMERLAKSGVRKPKVSSRRKDGERGVSSRWWTTILAIVAACSAIPASAVTIADDYAALLRERTEITRLDGDDMFGDSIGLYTGSIEFLHTDVSIPGNNSLEVGIKRRLNLTSPRGSIGFSDWELAIPNMHGVFSKYGWKGNDPDRSKRCTGFGEPPYERADPQSPNFPEMLISGREFWRGTFLYLPNAGDEEVLEAWPEHQKPSNGYVYALRTKGGAAIRCIPIGSGTEEGFEVLTPDGITYRLNHMVSRSDEPLLKSILNPPSGFDGIYYLQRNEYFLYPTSASDRFGNTVTYTWSTTNPIQLTRISSSDGRAIDIIYYEDERKKNKIRYVKHGSRTWEYMYENDAKLSSVMLPDTTSWTFQTYSAWSGPAEDSRCGVEGTRAGNGPSVSMTHPSGANAVFSMVSTLHGRSSSVYSCSSSLPEYQNISYEYYPAEYFMWSVKSKVISGLGIASPLVWTYTYGPANGCYSNTDIGNIRCTTTSAKTKWLDVKDPSDVSTRYTFGNELNVNEGNLLSVVNPEQTVRNAYHWTSPGPYPAAAGRSGQGRGFNFANRIITLRERTIERDGANFIWRANSYDTFARPLSVTKSSTITGNPVRTEVTAYHDDLSLWVLGQIKSVTCTAPAACTPGWAPSGIVMSQTDYGWKALPWKTYAYGKLQQQFGYDNTSTVASGQLGTLKQAIDGKGNITTLTGWKRGIPGKITYPATTDQPTAVFQQAAINDDGTIQSVTDENGYTTKYGYDPMGRLSLIDYPDGDTTVWTSITRDFALKAGIYGLPAHWRLWEYMDSDEFTGDGYKVTRYDALWRPVVEETYINGDASSYSIVVKRYDAAGRLAFQSYPLASLTNYADTTIKGTDYTYDSLGRLTTAVQDSELGALTTKTEYLTGFKTRVTNPRNKQTTTDYYAFDQPTTEWPLHIVHPEGAYTDIGRDIFGKPTWLRRRNADGTISATRNYKYYSTQELCRTDEPETGTSAMGYDDAGNLIWSASGYTTSATGCMHQDWVAARRTDRTYDARNRLKILSFADGRNNASTYTPDGLLATTTANNGDGNLVTTSYTYNRRRLLTSERMQWGSIDWTVNHRYNDNGHRSSLSFPIGGGITYLPDALGRPTQAETYATDVKYHPNGAIASFRYGNGIRHVMIQNPRGLPERSRDAYEGSGTHVFALDDSYDYDPNGNVLAISDGLVGARGDRDMVYDALDRLTKATSKMFGSTGQPTSAYYSYDVLDNLTRVNIQSPGNARTHYYCYNAKWQLAFLRTGNVCTGNTPSPPVAVLEYDLQGNLAERDNVSYRFDYGNRLRSVSSPATSYVYDGHGRRVRDVTGASKYSFYSQSGELLYSQDLRTGKQVRNVYLGGSLVAELERDTTSGIVTTRYMHTDALGSVVARSSSGRSSVVRNEYEPYGALINRSNYDRPGYTGHVMDAATGLTYMQQRYYDPMIGRFLSVDPVAAGPGPNFNRYSYANNNPYKFVDPDGRQTADMRMDSDSAEKERKRVREQVMGLGAVRSFADLPPLPDGVYNPESDSYTGESWERVSRPTGGYRVKWGELTASNSLELPIGDVIDLTGRTPATIVLAEAAKALMPSLLFGTQIGQPEVERRLGYQHVMLHDPGGGREITTSPMFRHGVIWTDQKFWTPVGPTIDRFRMRACYECD